METTKSAPLSAGEARPAKKARPRRTTPGAERVRYFLPQMGSTGERPELGQEVASEGEALVEALKSGQLFYTLMTWQAVPEMRGQEAKIVKQAFSRN